MRERRKLMKKTIQDSKVSETLISIDQKICASHQDEKLHDEQVAVAKIKDDPHFFLDMQKSQVFVSQTSAHYWTRLQIVLPMIIL